MKKSDTRTRGQWAEHCAEKHLRETGLRLLARNFRCRWGEIDLIMREQDMLVFVEVRYRGATSFATGIASVDSHKQARLMATAEHYLQRHPCDADRSCRFDVVSVSPDSIRWVKNAFSYH